MTPFASPTASVAIPLPPDAPLALVECDSLLSGANPEFELWNRVVLVFRKFTGMLSVLLRSHECKRHETAKHYEEFTCDECKLHVREARRMDFEWPVSCSHQLVASMETSSW